MRSRATSNLQNWDMDQMSFTKEKWKGLKNFTNKGPTPHPKIKESGNEIMYFITGKYHLRFDKMTPRVEPIILSKLNVLDNKASTSCSVLLVKWKYKYKPSIPYNKIWINKNRTFKKRMNQIHTLAPPMENGAPKIMSFSSQWECEEHRT